MKEYPVYFHVVKPFLRCKLLSACKYTATTSEVKSFLCNHLYGYLSKVLTQNIIIRIGRELTVKCADACTQWRCVNV